LILYHITYCCHQDLDEKILEAQAPIDQLDQQYNDTKAELTEKLSRAKSLAIQANRDHESLDVLGGAIEKSYRIHSYVS
jgi:hypothetical protein